MPLSALPVSISDLTQLQRGIEFFTDTNEATIEAGLINSPAQTATVYSYAAQLLANNISLSQVAMAVDSLMFGITDNVTELATLSRQFLPAQVANAVANGFNPTVYAAEALGLALAGGNGNKDNFATDFGSLTDFEFASKVSSITGVNAEAIQNFVQNWISFYTAHPAATFGLPTTLAAYGAAFGDAVGVALVNPRFNVTIALLDSEVQNALIDNAEGLYRANISLISEAPYDPLLGEAARTFHGSGTIDWTFFGNSNYDQFVSALAGDFTIKNAPSTFTLNTGTFGDVHYIVQIDPAVANADLLTLIVGDGNSAASLGKVFADGYSTVEVVANVGGIGRICDMTKGLEVSGDLVISGGAFLELGDITPFSVIAQTITVNNSVALILGTAHTEKIDASNSNYLVMSTPVDSQGFSNPTSGVIVIGSTSPFNILQGSLGPLSTVSFTNGSTGAVAGNYVGADHFVGGSGQDTIYGDGGSDTINLPEDHTLPDKVVFGQDVILGNGHVVGHDVFAITDGSDRAYLGSWGVGRSPTAIPDLFSGNTGGISANETVIFTGFHAGAGGDELDFTAAAWNGESAVLSSQGPLAAAKGDLVSVEGLHIVTLGAAQLSAYGLTAFLSMRPRPPRTCSSMLPLMLR